MEPYADGFIFEDGNDNANTLDDYRLLWSNQHNRSVLFPYLNGQEMNGSSAHVPTRYAVNFGNMDLVDAMRWPQVVAHIESKVKLQRQSKAADVSAWPWWKYWRSRPELAVAVGSRSHVFAIADTSSRFSVARVAAHYVLNKTLVVIALEGPAAFSTLQSSVHENWVRILGSSMKDDPRYTVERCFETFPFPLDYEACLPLDVAGKAYYDFHAALMIRNNEGLTKTYNRFHSDDPRLVTPDILELRRLHAAMDRAVLDAYGWTDIPTDCVHIPDYTETDDDGREVPKSIRYRWPDEVRDEVLARLLDRNEKRHKEEVRLGLHAKTKTKGGKKSAKAVGDGLFGEPEGDA